MQRINPDTGKPFKPHDKREDGFFFKEYIKKVKDNGFYKEKWQSPKTYFNMRFHNAYSRTLRSAGRQPGFEKLENNISKDYLISIFPQDSLCPVFGFEMTFGGDKNLSPSIDRVNPNKGYTKDNVVWISYLANRMKSDVSIDDLIKINQWAKKINEKK